VIFIIMKLQLTEEQYKRILGDKEVTQPITEQFSRGSQFRLSCVSYECLRSRWERDGKTPRSSYWGSKKVKLAGETWIEKIDEHTMGIKFHSTYIIKVDATDTMVIDCGGWSESPITRQRLEDCLYNSMFIRFWITNHVVYMSYRGETYVYEDGVKILPTGDVVLPE
jgi:hypothetical protein